MDYYENSNLDSLYAVFRGGLLVIGILLIVFGIIVIVANWKLYKKAGKSGWECIVPVYSYWVLVEIADLSWWWFLLAIADSIVTTLDIDELSLIANLASLFASFNIYYNVAKKFGKNNGVSVCAGIFSFIFVLIFGFSRDEVYDKNITVSPNGIFDVPDNNSSTNKTEASVDTNESNINNRTNKEKFSDDELIIQDYSFCGNCGTRLEKDIKFCPNCGKEKM